MVVGPSSVTAETRPARVGARYLGGNPGMRLLIEGTGGTGCGAWELPGTGTGAGAGASLGVGGFAGTDVGGGRVEGSTDGTSTPVGTDPGRCGAVVTTLPGSVPVSIPGGSAGLVSSVPDTIGESTDGLPLGVAGPVGWPGVACTVAPGEVVGTDGVVNGGFSAAATDGASDCNCWKICAQWSVSSRLRLPSLIWVALPAALSSAAWA